MLAGMAKALAKLLSMMTPHLSIRGSAAHRRIQQRHDPAIPHGTTGPVLTDSLRRATHIHPRSRLDFNVSGLDLFGLRNEDFQHARLGPSVAFGESAPK
jgi:DNA-binding transcriptional regulator YdaS (Cro superfamily)